MSADEVRVVLLTAPEEESARRIARALVEEGLAACVNVVPGIRSVYRWRGKIEEEAEQLLVAKTCSGRCEALAARVEALHPYELPEVLVLTVSGGSQRYLDWVMEECSE